MINRRCKITFTCDQSLRYPVFRASSCAIKEHFRCGGNTTITVHISLNETGNNLPDEAMQLSVENRNILAAHSPGSRSLLTLAVSYENMNDVRHFHCERSLDLSYNTVLPKGRPPPGMSEGSDW